MVIKQASELYQFAKKIFTACGAPEEEAAIVADELVETNLLGFDSHGVLRIPQYVDDVIQGRTKPGALVTIVKETPATAVVDCGHNFGHVSANKMVAIALEKASHMQLACITSKRCRHIGRLGAYVQKLAEQRMVGFAVVNGPQTAHLVSPWGGREGRLSTNPLAYAVPTSEHPIVFDMATSMIPEGKLRLLRNQGKPVPPGRIIDDAGNPTTDPNHFYAKGSILPFGSELGYKGFGLGLLVEILGSVLVGEAISRKSDYQNGFCLIAINPDAFCGRQTFVELMDAVSRYVTSCPTAPGFDEISLPGAPDFKTKQERMSGGIPVDDETWRLIVQAGEKVGCRI